MKILINNSIKLFAIDVDESISIRELKLKIQEIIQINAANLVLIHENKIFDDSSMLKNYPVHKNSIITVCQRSKGGIVQCLNPSGIAGDVYNRCDLDLLPIGRLNRRFIRNTNSTNVYFQRLPDCYA